MCDRRKPFAIFRFLPATHWERGMPHPIMVYASGSFCELTQYELVHIEPHTIGMDAAQPPS